MNGSQRLILTYHSISTGSGPTCIAPGIFRDQAAALEDAGYVVHPLAQFVELWQAGALSGVNAAALTFDDGFADFLTSALPVLAERNWRATIFVPAGKVGGDDDWEANASGHVPRRLMSWQELRAASQAGHEIGSHSMTHADLTALNENRRIWELSESKRILREEIGKEVLTFAAPYGRTDAALEDVVSRHYAASAGTTLSRLPMTGRPFDLPRIEMWYFRDHRRWKTFLLGGARTYFFVRQALRAARTAVSRRRRGPITGQFYKSDAPPLGGATIVGNCTSSRKTSRL